MKIEVIFSLVLHLLIVLFTIVSSPFEMNKPELGEVIRVTITSPAELPSSEPEPLPPVPVPQPVMEELPEIPVSDPATAEPAQIKPKKKPEQKKPKEKSQRRQDTKSAKEAEDVEVPGTGAGTPFGGATIDNATFNYPYWFRQAFMKLSQNFRNPIAYDGTLICTIYFQVIKSGRVLEFRIVESSGFEVFDAACMAAVERSAPFPPLPREFADEIIGITVPFTNR